MEPYKETFETWNKIAQLYQDKFMDLDLYNETYDYLVGALGNTHSSVLEIGCGPGNITRYLLSKKPDLDILGIDVAPNMIDLARMNNPAASFRVMDARRIRGLTREFDAIISGFCLPYLSMADSEKFISDSNNLLKDSGLLYLSFVEGDPDLSGFLTGSTGDRTYFYYYRSEDLTPLLRVHGFETDRIFRLNYLKNDQTSEIHTVVIARKTG